MAGSFTRPFVSEGVEEGVIECVGGRDGVPDTSNRYHHHHVGCHVWTGTPSRLPYLATKDDPGRPCLHRRVQDPCAWIGETKDFGSYAELAVVDYWGSTDMEKDASCCSRCDCYPGCEFWVRDPGSSGCHLHNGFAGFSPSTTMRGNFRNASKAAKAGPSCVVYVVHVFPLPWCRVCAASSGAPSCVL